MPVSQESMKEKLVQAFPGAIKTEVFDISGGCGQSYEVRTRSKGRDIGMILTLPDAPCQVLIVSDEFSGKNLLTKHRLVNERLKEEIAELHAFTQKTYTPEQFAKLNITQT
ncbi:bola protein [Melampsora americana]|nr:bola protein [Melampsora americana]